MNDIKKVIMPILQSYGVKKAAIFGSFARDEQTDQSDVDILIEPPDSMGLSFVRLKRDLEEKLNKKVDLVTYRTIHPLLRQDILKNQKIIYDTLT
jgi:predicted nucleotidyltransferase